MDARIARFRVLLERVFRGRRVVLAGGPVAGATPRVAGLRALGAERCLVLGAGRGTGPLPADRDADVVSCELPRAADVAASIRAEEALFRELPASFSDALARFDGRKDAIVLAPPFAALDEIAGRPVYGGRRPEWVALEDKVLNDELFAAAGVPAPPFEIVPARRATLAAAAARLDRGAGTVWAGDAMQGFNGGTAYVRWVRTRADAVEAAAHLGQKCARVRVAPFVEGIPCSIHGFVTDDGVAAFRPVELLTLRRNVAPRLRFAGACTIWDPPDDDRAAMRDAAVRLGTLLRERAAFRGVFTIDGILSESGWVATECNPRFGAALQYARVALPMLALDLLHHVVIAGDGGEVRARELEQLVLSEADAHRWGASWVPTDASWIETDRVGLRGDEGGYRVAMPTEDPDATLSYGPGPTGGFVRCEFRTDRVPTGASLAPRAVAALAFADAHCGARIGPLRAPRSARGVGHV
jgi:hypothetical protein